MIEKVCTLFQPKTEWLYEYTKSHNRIPTITMDEVIQERQYSGQSISDFCQEKGISKHSYFYWQRQLRKVACMELSKRKEETIVSCVPEGWMQLSQGQETKSTLDIEVGGCHVTVDAETDLELLKKVCRILRVL